MSITMQENRLPTLYTRDKAVMRKLDTLVVDFPTHNKLTGQDEYLRPILF